MPYPEPLPNPYHPHNGAFGNAGPTSEGSDDYIRPGGGDPSDSVAWRSHPNHGRDLREPGLYMYEHPDERGRIPVEPCTGERFSDVEPPPKDDLEQLQSRSCPSPPRFTGMGGPHSDDAFGPPRRRVNGGFAGMADAQDLRGPTLAPGVQFSPSGLDGMGGQSGPASPPSPRRGSSRHRKRRR